MDGDGAFRLTKPHDELIAYDMQVLRFIRGEWNRLRSEKMKKEIDVRR